MAFDPQQEGEDADLADINVTPLIDVMLVLVMVFMVAAPLATVDVPVSLPSSGAMAEPRQDPIWLTLRDDGAVWLGQSRIAGDLAGALAQAAQGDTERVVNVQADRAADYGQVMAVLDRVRAAGYAHIALVAQDASSGVAP